MITAPSVPCCFFFFFNDTATTEIYTLSLHDALPILPVVFRPSSWRCASAACASGNSCPIRTSSRDRKSTRLNSSHSQISYAVFCLKKKKLLIHDTSLLRTRDLHDHTLDSAPASIPST